jgi:hypothetical protein
MRITLLRRGPRGRSLPHSRAPSSGAQRVEQLGQSLLLLATGVAVLLAGVGIMFACAINEPIYHRVGSAMILGVVPGLAAYATGRLLRRCLIGLSLICGPFRLVGSRAMSHLSKAAVAAGCGIGRSSWASVGAALRSMRHAWKRRNRTPLPRAGWTVTWPLGPLDGSSADNDRLTIVRWLIRQLRTIAPISRRPRLPVRI